jgi:hypothetical protein
MREVFRATGQLVLSSVKVAPLKVTWPVFVERMKTVPRDWVVVAASRSESGRGQRIANASRLQVLQAIEKLFLPSFS